MSFSLKAMPLLGTIPTTATTAASRRLVSTTTCRTFSLGVHLLQCSSAKSAQHPQSPLWKPLRKPRTQQQGSDILYEGGWGEELDAMGAEDEEQEHLDKMQRKRNYIHQKGSRFADLRRLHVHGGKGGLGCVSWRKEPGERFSHPDGADGGRGGDVIFMASEHVGSTLSRVLVAYKGNAGTNAQGQGQSGRRGEDLIVKVPMGTLVKNGEEPHEVLADLVEDGDCFTAALGGQGGRGNVGGSANTRSTDPFEDAVQGHPGEEFRYELELKTIADVGLVGLPNAGKSTFLSSVSNAHPKVAPYPFTTLNPHLGVVEFADHWRMQVADIPGLAIGASENVGLGHVFLRHIERSPVLLYVIDMSETNGSLHPVEALKALRLELEQYKKGITKRPSIIAANKMDLKKSKKNLEKLKKTTKIPIVPISASTGIGVLNTTGLMRTAVEYHQKQVKKNKVEHELNFVENLFAP